MLIRRHGFAGTTFASEAYSETAVAATFRCRGCIILLSSADKPTLTGVTAVSPYLFSDTQPETKRLRNIGRHGGVALPAEEKDRATSKENSTASVWRGQCEESPVRQREKERATKKQCKRLQPVNGGVRGIFAGLLHYVYERNKR